MKDLNESEIEYFEGISDKNHVEDQELPYNRRNVDNLKRLICASFVLMCCIPVFFCLYLMVKMNRLDARVDTLKKNLSVMTQVEQVAIRTESTEGISASDKELLDQGAAQELEKTPGESTSVLMGSSESQDASVEDITMSGTVTESGVAVSQPPTTESESVSVNTKYKVYLTFDDGPSIYTDEILDTLKANDVKATFFVVYNPDRSLWPMYQRIVEEGHTLAMHSYTHVYEDIYSNEAAFKDDVSSIHHFLYEQTGVDVKYYRFPGGSSNSVGDVDIQDLMGYLYESGITYYDWNALSEDALDPSLTSEELNDNVMGYVRANQSDSIVLLHDLENAPGTPEGLQQLIDTLKEEGYQLCPIDDNTIPVQHITYEGE